MADKDTKEISPQVGGKKLLESPKETLTKGSQQRVTNWLAQTAKEVNPATSSKSPSATTARPTFQFPPTVQQLSTWYHNKDASDEPHSLYYVKIVIEQSDLPHGAVIWERIPRDTLFRFAPKLVEYLDEMDTKVILPANSADEDTVYDVVVAIITAEKQKTELMMRMDRTPVNLIKMHAVFVLFGMKKEADDVRGAAWDAMALYELSPGEVDWIWDTYGVWDSGVEIKIDTDVNTEQNSREEIKTNINLWKLVNRNKEPPEFSQDHVAPYAKEYVDMMAYQILNLEALGKVNDVILKMILDRCPSLQKVLVLRKEKFGLAPGYKAPPSPFGTSNMNEHQSKMSLTAFQKTVVALTPSPAEKKASAVPKPQPHLTPTMQAALNRKPSVLDLSRATTGITVNKPEDGKRLPLGGEVSSWIDQDPDRPSKSSSSFPSGAPMFTSGGFMKSVEVSMTKDDDEVDVFWQAPANDPGDSFQTDSSLGDILHLKSSKNIKSTGRVSAPDRKVAGLPMADQATQTGASFNAMWGFPKESEPESGASSLVNESSSAAGFRGNNGNHDTPRSASNLVAQQPSDKFKSFGGFGSSHTPCSGPSTMSFGGMPLNLNSTQSIPANPFSVDSALHAKYEAFRSDVSASHQSASSAQAPPPASLGSNSLFNNPHMNTGAFYPSMASQSFNSSGGTTTAFSTPTQSFIEGAAWRGGLGTGNPVAVTGNANNDAMDGVENNEAMNGNGNSLRNDTGAGGGDNMFAFQSSGSPGARKMATPKGRLNRRR